MDKTEAMLLLLYSPGTDEKFNEPIIGITRLTKLVYLLQQEGGIKSDFEFIPYKMGPYSSDIYTEIEFQRNFPRPDKPILSVVSSASSNKTYSLEQTKYLEDMAEAEDSAASPTEVDASYSLTDLGEKLAKKVWENTPEDQRKSFRRIKEKYASLPLNKLLRYVYDSYPDMTKNSEIIDKVYRY